MGITLEDVCTGNLWLQSPHWAGIQVLLHFIYWSQRLKQWEEYERDISESYWYWLFMIPLVVIAEQEGEDNSLEKWKDSCSHAGAGSS
jgi:hypothetical protein